MILDDYEQQLFWNLEKNIEDFRWYKIEEDREDRKRFVETIKKRIDIFNDFEFNHDYSKFRKIEPYKPIRNISFEIEWHPNSYELNDKERNLPEPIFRNLTKKEREHYQSRRTDI